MKEDKQLTIEGFEDFAFNEENLQELEEELGLQESHYDRDPEISERSRQICVEELLK